MNEYDSLAAFLNPEDHEDGKAQIDIEILRYERGCEKNANLSVAWRWLIWVSPPISTLMLVGHIHMLIAPPFFKGAYHEFMSSMAQAIPWPIGVIGLCLGFLGIFSDPFGRGKFVAPPLPSAMEDWFTANGNTSGLSHWYEVHWDWRKRSVHRREWNNFVFWRRTICQIDQYPPLPKPNLVLPNRHYAYLNSLEGRADWDKFGSGFKKRMDDWHKVMFKIWIGLISLIFVPGLIQIFEPSFLSTSGAKVTIVLGLVITMWLRMAGLFVIPLRRCPRRFQNYWVRNLPDEGKIFYYHKIQVTG